MPKIVDHDERRDEFAAAAARVISREGMSGVTLKNVAKEAGMTHGALGHYVRTKDELLQSAVAYHSNLTQTGIVEYRKKHKGLDAIRKVMYTALPINSETPGAWNIWIGMWERSHENPEMRAILKSYYEYYHDLFEQLIKEAKRLREIPSDINIVRAARSAVAHVDGIGIQVLLSGRVVSPQSQREYVNDWINAVLRPSQAKS